MNVDSFQIKEDSSDAYIISGGAGFVGKALLKALLDRGDRVLSLSRGTYPELEELGAQTLSVDLGTVSADELTRLIREKGFADAKAFFHVASHVKMWGKYEDFYQSNVKATETVIELCRKLSIPKLVFTSSPSVIADGSNLRGIDESYPYPKKHLAYYPKTKAMAERAVLAANGTELYTCALRPHLIFGPGDSNLAPTILKKASLGQLVRIGSGDNKVDFCFIDDCVKAHLLADKALEANPQARGQAFFISQGDPTELWVWIDRLLEMNGLKPVARSIPPKVAFTLATVFEWIACVSGREPRFTRFLVEEMATDHYFSIDKARRILGFQPSVKVLAALESLRA